VTRPLPDVPACWSWPPPPLPQSNRLVVIAKWQAGRCAVCGVHCPDATGPFVTGQRRVGLDQDHDHSTGDTRGYLCPPCNTAEGSSAALVFERYRERNPASIFGVRLRYGPGPDPDDQSAQHAWNAALESLRSNAERMKRHANSLRLDEEMRAIGHHWVAPELNLDPVTPLMAAAERVGLTQEEWRETLRERKSAAEAEVVHLAADAAVPRQACDAERGWRAPSARGRRAPCPDCHQLDRARLARLVGEDEYGFNEVRGVRCSLLYCSLPAVASISGSLLSVAVRFGDLSGDRLRCSDCLQRAMREAAELAPAVWIPAAEAAAS